MLENLALSFAACFIAGGAALLYDSLIAHDAAAGFRLLAAAVVLAAGLVTAALTLRSKFHWWRVQKQNRPRT